MFVLKPEHAAGDTALRFIRLAGRMTDEQLAQAMQALVTEFSGRATAAREMELVKARELWPSLVSSARLAGRRISQVSLGRGPVLTGWCLYPVAACEGYRGKKPKSKKQAMQMALTFGDHWATMGELWQWVQGGGPIVHRAMSGFGYGGPGQRPKNVSELYPWPPSALDS